MRINTKSYEECVLKAVNLGKDTDTVAAIAGSIAGAIYGYDAIPKNWINTLQKKDYIVSLCEKFATEVTREEADHKHIRRMVDVHAHVLFGIDDGAKSYEMSKEMLTSLYDQGVTDVICTSHSWGHLDKYASHFKQLSEVYDERPIGLYPGCEIEAYSPEDIPDVLERLLYRKEISTLNETDYILLEFLPNDSYEDIIKATHIFHVHAPNKVIILAHVERYIDLYRHREALERLEGMGCLFQINAHSLVDESKFETKNFARWLLHSRKVSFLGSDAHRMDHRPPNVASGIEYIFDHYPEEYAKDVCYRNAEKFLLRKI